jgi:hypothetical protein
LILSLISSLTETLGYQTVKLSIEHVFSIPKFSYFGQRLINKYLLTDLNPTSESGVIEANGVLKQVTPASIKRKTRREAAFVALPPVTRLTCRIRKKPNLTKIYKIRPNFGSFYGSNHLNGLKCFF